LLVIEHKFNRKKEWQHKNLITIKFGLSKLMS
jgi:hypothetical protein